MSEEHSELIVPPEAAGERLDRYLAEALGRSRSAVARWIDGGGVRQNGLQVARSLKLGGGERLELLPDEAEGPSELEPEDIPLTILHEDEDILVLDKQSGLVVHPGAGVRTGTLVHGLVSHLGRAFAAVGATGRPGIVHRLDKGTTGVMVVAKTAAAHAALGAQFASRTVEKVYLALVLGVPKEDHGLVDAPIGRSPKVRVRMSVVPDGREARTGWRLVEAFGRHAALLRVELFTGRTHQVRVHLTHAGHPLVGDPEYGAGRVKVVADARIRSLFKRLERPALHAARLGLDHPRSGERMVFEARLPADLDELLTACRKLGGSE